jgi:hypothetical protein
MTDDLDEIFGIPMPEKKNEETSGSEEAAFSDTMNDSNGSSFSDQTEKLETAVSKLGRSSKVKIGNKSGGKNEIQNTQDGSNSNEIIQHSDSRVEKHYAMGNSEPSKQTDHEEKVDTSVSKKTVTNTGSGYGGIFHGFVLECNDYELSNFYNIKQDALATWLLPGGALNFSSITEELRQARPDLSKVVFGDMESMFIALRQIQKWKDRITSMQVDINQQYFPWKRAMELFRGTLARHRYEKPSERQEGVVMEHMGDMVMYFSKLESIHASISAVAENLDAAFECISRQITMSVSTIGKDTDLVEKKVNAMSSIESDMNDFDKIGDVKTVKSNAKTAFSGSNKKDQKAGETNWI